LIRKTVVYLLILGTFNLLFSAPKTNLEIIYGLLQKSVEEITNRFQGNIGKVSVDFIAPDQYKILGNRLIYYLNEEGYLQPEENGEKPVELKYALEKVNVNYSDSFRDGLLGKYKVKRDVSISGTYVTGRGEKVIFTNTFNNTYSDTVNYSDVEKLQSLSVPFTKSELPPEPLFDSLLEPVVAIGTLIVTVILLFTVRSK